MRDPQTCRRALREIGEIAAVAGLEGGRMTDQEALQSIAAIAEWVMDEAPGARADCGEVVRRLERGPFCWNRDSQIGGDLIHHPCWMEASRDDGSLFG